MLKRLFGRAGGSGAAGGTPGKVKRASPLSTKDFRANAPDAPTNDVLRAKVSEYVVRTSSDQPAHYQDFLRRQMFFDMRHRCGAQGRCMVGANLCTHPKCFTWRPSIKGGDVLSEKGSIEESIIAMSGASLPASIKAIIEQSQRDENLEEVATKIGVEIDALFERAKREAAAYVPPPPLEPTGDAARDKAAAEERAKKLNAVTTPERLSDDLSGKLIILGVWRAVVLVNARRDADAVTSLLELLPRIPKDHRGAIYGAAAGWALLHDMEVRFFRYHLKFFPELAEELHDPKIAERADTQLDRVLAACEGEVYFIEHVAHEVFGKEISAIVARAQNAQESDDTSEDPMGTPFVAENVFIYKHRLGPVFWDCFMKLAMMPPLNPQKEKASATQTPRYILDALGRSMLLHHVAALYGPLPSEMKKAQEQSRLRFAEKQAAPGNFVPPEDPIAAAAAEAKAKGLQDSSASVPPQSAAAAEAERKVSEENLLRQKAVVGRMRELIDVVKNAQAEAPPKR